GRVRRVVTPVLVQPRRPEQTSRISLPPQGTFGLDAREGGEAAVDRDHSAGDKARAGTAEPHRGRDEVVGLAEATERRFLDDRPAALGRRAVRPEKKRTVLIADKEAGRDRVDANPYAATAELD